MHIFVSLDGCNTKGDGSIDRPFQTLDHAQSVVKPGQTVYFREGVYPVELTDLGVIYCKGTADDWITFMPYNNERVVFDGGGRSMLISSFNSLITMYKCEYVIIDGFEVRNMWGQGITNYDTFHTIVRNCKVHNFHSRGLGGHGRYNTYENNEVFHTCMANEGASAGGWSSALATINRPGFVHSSNIVMRGNKVYENWGEGINSFLATNVLLADNEARDNFSVNMYCDTSTNVTMENNTITSKNTRYYRDGSPAAGIQISNEGSRTTMRVKPYPCAENIIILNNIIDGACEGIAYWEDKNNTWESNTYRDIEIYGNTFNDIWDYDIHVNRVSMPNVEPPRNVKAYDNILSGSDKRLLIGNPEAWDLKNNIFKGTN